MVYRPAVKVEQIKGGARVCTCHGWSVRRIWRATSWKSEYVHCEHPERYIVHGDGYIPDYCEACGWNLGRYDRRT